MWYAFHYRHTTDSFADMPMQIRIGVLELSLESKKKALSAQLWPHKLISTILNNMDSC